MKQSTEHENLTKHLEWFLYIGTESIQQREDGYFTMNFMRELEHDMPKNETRVLFLTIYSHYIPNQLQGEQLYESQAMKLLEEKWGRCFRMLAWELGARAFLDDSKSQVTLAKVTRESHQPVKASTQKRK